jgi:hypothetical protein
MLNGRPFNLIINKFSEKNNNKVLADWNNSSRVYMLRQFDYPDSDPTSLCSFSLMLYA